MYIESIIYVDAMQKNAINMGRINPSNKCITIYNELTPEIVQTLKIL